MGVEVSHLLFVDDTLILCDANKENLEYLCWVFMWFEVILGLKINLEKKELIPIGNVSKLEELVEILGCKVCALPTTYLGLPLGAPHKSYRVWEGVEERFQKRLTLWKRLFFELKRVASCEIGKDSKGFSIGRGVALAHKPHLVN